MKMVDEINTEAVDSKPVPKCPRCGGDRKVEDYREGKFYTCIKCWQNSIQWKEPVNAQTPRT